MVADVIHRIESDRSHSHKELLAYERTSVIDALGQSAVRHAFYAVSEEGLKPADIQSIKFNFNNSLDRQRAWLGLSAEEDENPRADVVTPQDVPEDAESIRLFRERSFQERLDAAKYIFRFSVTLEGGDSKHDDAVFYITNRIHQIIEEAERYPKVEPRKNPLEPVEQEALNRDDILETWTLPERSHKPHKRSARKLAGDAAVAVHHLIDKLKF